MCGHPHGSAIGGAPSRSSMRMGILYAGVAAAGFGTSYTATALAEQGLSPAAVVVWRGFLSAAILAVWYLGSGAWARTLHGGRRHLLHLCVLGVLGGPASIVAMNLSVAASGAMIAAFVVASSSALAAVLAPWVLPEKLGLGPAIGFAIALVGTALLAQLEPSRSAAIGIGLGLVTAANGALFLVLSRRWSASREPEVVAIALAIAIANVAVGVPVWWLMGSPAPRTHVISAVSLIALAWLALVPGIVAQVAVVAGVRRAAVQPTAGVLLLNPVVGAASAMVLLGEMLTTPQLVGAGLLLVGTALASSQLGHHAGKGDHPLKERSR